MIPLYTSKELDDAKYNYKLPLLCEHCKDTFYAFKKNIVSELKQPKRNRLKYCSQKCHGSNLRKKEIVECAHCNTKVSKQQADIRKSKSGNHFCSKSCAAIYNNAHKTIGTRRSKLEIWLESQLVSLYPNLNFEFNQKNTINSEIDIYIPLSKTCL